MPAGVPCRIDARVPETQKLPNIINGNSRPSLLFQKRVAQSRFLHKIRSFPLVFFECPLASWFSLVLLLDRRDLACSSSSFATSSAQFLYSRQRGRGLVTSGFICSAESLRVWFRILVQLRHPWVGRRKKTQGDIGVRECSSDV